MCATMVYVIKGSFRMHVDIRRSQNYAAHSDAEPSERHHEVKTSQVRYSFTLAAIKCLYSCKVREDDNTKNCQTITEAKSPRSMAIYGRGLHFRGVHN